MGTEHAFLQTIIDNLQEGVIVANQDGNFIAFNRVAEQILGLGSVNIRKPHIKSMSCPWCEHYRGIPYPTR